MPSKKCGANKTDGTGTCGQAAGWGTDHPGYGTCKKHGGSTPASSKHARTEMAREVATTYGVPVEIDPAEGLLDEVARTYGHVLYLLDKVREQEPDALVWGMTDETHKQATEFPGVDMTYQAKPNAWLDAYRQERAHFVKVCAETLKAGVEERRVRLYEQRGEQLAQWMRALAEAWGVPDTPETWEAARARLRLVEGGAA